VAGERVWMACDCGAGIAHPVGPAELEPTAGRRAPPSRWRVPQSRRFLAPDGITVRVR
jgi:hypothetical protein